MSRSKTKYINKYKRNKKLAILCLSYFIITVLGTNLCYALCGKRSGLKNFGISTRAFGDKKKIIV